MELVVETYKPTELGLIPDDWKMCLLGECLIESPQYGINAAAVAYDDTLPRYLRITDISEDGKYLQSNKASVNNSLSNLYFLQEGDIVFARTGASVGKTYLYDPNDGELVFAGFLIRVKANPEILDYRYLKYLTQTEPYWAWVAANSMRSGQPGLNSSQIKSFPIVLPPTTEEQTAIATTLSDADTLISNLEKLISKKRNIKQGAMQKLLQPKEGWEVKKLGDLTKVFTKQTGFDYTAYIKPALVQYRTDDTIPFIQNKDFNNRWINFNTDYFIPKSVAIQFPNILLNEKSLLISISGSVGNVGIYNSEELAFIGGAVAILKFKDSGLIDWVMFYLKSVEGQKKLLDNVKAGSHQNLILDDIRKIEIVFPSKKDQTIIDNILTDMDNEIAALEIKLEKYRRVKLGMMQNLLTGKIRLV